MTSAARIAANRRNALRSTGPRTAAGKMRASQNARKHGLSVDGRYGAEVSKEIEEYATAMAGQNASPRMLAAAREVARTQLEIERVQKFKVSVMNGCAPQTDAPAFLRALSSLAEIDRYEARALSQHQIAMRKYMAACKE